MKHYGDITKLNGAEIPIVDVITGGSPCQDLSVANGKRAGLAGERSGLFMEQIRIVKEQRNECIRQLSMRGADVDFRLVKPRWLVWENVPGAFSSNKGEDFRCVLEEICRIADKTATVPMPEKGKWSTSGAIVGSGWSVAWRVHDAQFWGVPQRRRRIAVVADFGSESAPEILFERKSLSGNTEQSQPSGKAVTREITDSSGKTSSYTLKVRGGAEFDRYGKRAGKGALVQEELSGTLGVSQDQTLITEEPILLSTNQNDAEISQTGICNTIPASMGMGGGYVPMITDSVGQAYDGSQISPTLTANNAAGQQRMPDKDNFNAVITYGVDCYNQTQTEEVCKSLNSAATDSDHVPCVYGANRVFNIMPDVTPKIGEEEVAFSLRSRDYKDAQCIAQTVHGDEITPTLVSSMTTPVGNTQDNLAVVIENHPADSRAKISEDGIVQTLSSRMGTGGNNTPMVMAFGNKSFAGWTEDITSLRASGGDYGGGSENLCVQKTYQNTTGTLCSVISKGTSNEIANNDMLISGGSIVRRLTPKECERLQGFPDDWTNLGEWTDSKGKKHKDADSPRYKALGNSIALPFWEWLAGRIAEKLTESGVKNPTMGSLFDGIGGFPLVFTRCGVTPVWASEIEEFPIAVTKKHFPEKGEEE